MAENYKISVKIDGDANGLKNAAEESKSALDKLKDSADNNITKTGQAITKIGTAIMPASVAVGGLGVAAVKTAADFDTSMAKVAAVSGATGSDLEALRDKAKEMGANTKFSASEAADAMNYMAMAGWKTQDMLSGISGIMSLAAASGEDLATTSDIVTDALTAFGLTAADSAHFADILAAASSNANTNVYMMGETFKYVAPVAGSMGFSAEHVAESIGLMANAGIKASQAGTSLRAIMTRIATDAGASSKQLGAMGIITKELGVAVLNADGSFRDWNSIINETRVAWQGLTEEQQVNFGKQIAGQEAIAGWSAIMNASATDIDKLSGAIENCNGMSEEMAAIMQDNLNGSLDSLRSKAESLAISAGEMLMPMAIQLVEGLQKIVDAFNGLDDGTKRTIIQVGLFVAAAGPVLLVVGKIITAIGTVVGAIQGVIGVITTLAGAGGIGAIVTAAAPFLVGGAIVAGVIAGAVLIATHFEELKEVAGKVVDWVTDKFSKLVEFFSKIGDKIGGFLEGVGNKIEGWFSTDNPTVSAELERDAAAYGYSASGATSSRAVTSERTLNTTNNINVYANRNQKASDVAREVEKKLTTQQARRNVTQMAY